MLYRIGYFVTFILGFFFSGCFLDILSLYIKMKLP